MTRRRVLASRHVTLLYEWDGCPAFWGARLQQVLARMERLKQDDRASGFSIKVCGERLAPEDIIMVKHGMRDSFG